MTHSHIASVSRLLPLLVGTAWLLVGCSKPAPPEEPVRAVKVMTVGAASMQANTEYSAEVRPRIESRLGFRVAGKLVKRHVEAGQQVKAGQLLAELDPQDYALAVQAANAQVALASTNQQLAQADYQRYKALKEQNFISAAELERRDTALKSAQAQLDQAQAQRTTQKNQVGYTRLLADAAGVVTAVEAEPGQVVGAGAVVVRVAQDGPRDVVFSVPEDRVGTMRVGLALDVRGLEQAGSAPSAPPTGALKGVVREVAASADPVTRTFSVKVALQAREVPPLGATMTVLVPAMGSQSQAVIKLPTSALRQVGQATAVWVLEPSSMTVKSQTVQLATVDGNDVVVASGFQPGMQVVSAGVHVLSAGQKVTIYQDKYRDKPAEQPAGQAPSSGQK